MNLTMRLFFALPLAVCLFPARAHAQNAAPAPAPAPQTYSPAPPPPPGFHLHDGTYVRLQLGFAFANFSTSDPILGKAEFSGGGASVGVAVGGAIVPNLVLYGTFIMAGASNPELKVEGASVGSASGDLDIVALGGGAAYYLMPLSLYFAGSLLAAEIQGSNNNGRATRETDFGLGFEGLVGKEWWVSDNWGLGAALQVLYATMTDQALDSSGNPFKWKASSFALLFSATFN